MYTVIALEWEMCARERIENMEIKKKKELEWAIDEAKFSF